MDIIFGNYSIPRYIPTPYILPGSDGSKPGASSMSLPVSGHVRGFYVFAISFLRILWNYQTVVAVFSPIKHVYRLRGRIVKDKKLLLG